MKASPFLGGRTGLHDIGRAAGGRFLLGEVEEEKLRLVIREDARKLRGDSAVSGRVTPE